MKSGMCYAAIGLATTMLATLAGCGGGSIWVGVESRTGNQTFVAWVGNSSAEQVIDVNNDAFAFFRDTGCLYSFQTGWEHPNFCLTSIRGTAMFGAIPVRIANVRSTVGTCIAALIHEPTASFIDIQIDQLGTEIALVTSFRPEFCIT